MNFIRQLFCSHEFVLEDLERINDNLVHCPCVKCGKMLKAPYGLALNGTFVAFDHKERSRVLIELVNDAAK